MVKFSRKLAPPASEKDETTPKVLSENGTYDFNYAYFEYPTSYVNYHGRNFGFMKVKLNVNVDTDEVPHKFTRFANRYHKICMWIAWGPVVDIGITLAAFYKHKWKYYQLAHLTLLSFTEILTVIFGVYNLVFHWQM